MKYDQYITPNTKITRSSTQQVIWQNLNISSLFVDGFVPGCYLVEKLSLKNLYIRKPHCSLQRYQECLNFELSRLRQGVGYPCWGDPNKLTEQVIRLSTVQKFWKSVNKSWQSYRQFKGGNFLRHSVTMCTRQDLGREYSILQYVILTPDVYRVCHYVGRCLYKKTSIR